MQIKRLQIDDYLCLVDFDIVFDTVSGGSSTILIGENGAGKSTMIECILNILMSFDSPAIEKQIDYSYSMEYNYAQKAVCIVQSNHNYRITVDDVFCEGSYKRVRSFIQSHSLFPQRIIAFYSGANNKLLPQIERINISYVRQCRNTLVRFLKAMNDESELFFVVRILLSRIILSMHAISVKSNVWIWPLILIKLREFLAEDGSKEMCPQACTI